MASCAMLCILLVAICSHTQLRGKATPSSGITITTGLFESWDDFNIFLNSDKPAEYSEMIQLPR